jgi:hypothetical protein
MKERNWNWPGVLVWVWAALVTVMGTGDEPVSQPSEGAELHGASSEQSPIEPAPIANFVTRGTEWLIQAQHENGGWGAGSHARQEVRDPHQVQVDPATTAFTCLALLRCGHTPTSGGYQSNVRRAVEYLVGVVEEASDDGPRITDLTGTQPQSKLGPLVDTSLAAQYLARVLPTIAQTDPLRSRVDRALDKCLRKLSASQQQDGSWGRNGGWAPVLQSSLSCTALEVAAATGKQVDRKLLQRARDYQKQNVDAKSGRAEPSAAAGVELYAFAGGGRGNAADAREASDTINQAIQIGELSRSAPVTEENLRRAGVRGDKVRRLAAAYAQHEAQLKRLDDETMLQGFGSNGGEEFLSYLMTSEALVIAGAEKFHTWNHKMHERLEKIQNEDGSWSGHHCIASPVFCTAAVVQCLTTDRDAEFLVNIARKQAEVSVATSR